jgi:hypothetical protein
MHHQKMRTEISAAKREADYFKSRVEQSKSKRRAEKRKNSSAPAAVPAAAEGEKKAGGGGGGGRKYEFRNAIPQFDK